jgi:hypothetical protein
MSLNWLVDNGAARRAADDAPAPARGCTISRPG